MEGEEGKISVWVCREEKLISGLSRRTTCADVVRVLLHQHQARGQPSVLSGSSDSYCLVEKWRGFERVLPHKSRILRLWTAWGSEQENVRFVLVKQDASLPNNSPRSAEARVVASKDKKEGPGPARVYKGTARVTMAFSPEKQRRIVRKAFRKLEKINKKRAQALGGKQPSVEKMETLVHLIVSQDHTIRQQVQRIREIDREIHLYEARVHLDRVKAHGNNYVQDTYLEQQGLQERAGGLGGEQQQQQQHLSPEVRAQLEEYTRRCEEVAKLQEELSGHEAQLDTVTMEITEELNRRWMERRKPEQQEEASSCRHRHPGSPGDDDGDSPPGASRLAPDTAPESRGEEEEERIKTQLDASLYVGLRLATDLEAINGDLSCSGDLWSAREGELRDLLARVRALDLCADQDEDEEEELSAAEAGGEREPWVTEPEPESAWLLEQARGLSKSKPLEGDDDDDGDDSDTGLSSLHSQDSDSARTAAESLV